MREALSKDEKPGNKLKILKKYARDLGYPVVPGKNCRAFFYSKKITMNTRLCVEKQIYALAHEIGHVATVKRCVKQFGTNLFSIARSTPWYTLEAELTAWNYAEKLAKRLGFYSVNLLKYKHSCLRSYYRSNY